MRSVLTFLGILAIGALAYFGWVVSQPPAVVVTVMPTPTPKPQSTLAGFGEGATLLAPTMPIKHIDSLGTIVPQTSPPPKHH